MGVKAIMLDHGSSHLNTGSALTTKLSELFEHWITWRERKYCSFYAGVGKTTLEWIKHFKIDSDLVLSNAVDLEAFETYKKNQVRNFKEEYKIPSNAIVLSFVGRLTVEKGVRELVNVMKRVNEARPDVYCLLAGSGYLLEEMEKTKSDNTIFIGSLATPEVASLLCQSDIFCLPSYSEGFPTCVIEACVCGSYIITTHRGDAKEIVIDDEHGIILPDANEDGLYDAIMRSLDNKEHRDNATRLCYDRVINNYTWKHTADALLGLIDKEVL
jgi:glycosyltransferase involved in cell wall biosynthesis